MRKFEIIFDDLSRATIRENGQDRFNGLLTSDWSLGREREVELGTLWGEVEKVNLRVTRVIRPMSNIDLETRRAGDHSWAIVEAEEALAES